MIYVVVTLDQLRKGILFIIHDYVERKYQTTYNAKEATSVLLILVGVHALTFNVARAAMDDDAGLHLH